MKPTTFARRITLLWRVSWWLLLVASAVASEFKPLAVGAIGMTVSDMDRSIAFYHDALAFEKITDQELHSDEFDRLVGIFAARVRIVDLRLGEETLRLTQYLNAPGRPMPPDSRSNDLWFQHIAIVVRDMDTAYARVRSARALPISTEPQTIPASNAAAGGIRAFYFRDPDNHSLELISFPMGKGDPRWHRATDALFLGIDHTAIAVADTDASLKFYRDHLGLRVAGESLNFGREQEHLSRVAGARVRITSLRAPRGPGIEFLEYLAPRDGRPALPEGRANDISYWQITILVESAAPLAAQIPVTALGAPSVAFQKDPDCHTVQITRP